MAGKHSTDEWTTRPLTKSDYDYIGGVIDRWWGGPTSTLAHPIFFYELGEMARVVEHDGKPVGFLFGFIAGSGQVGYIHLVGIAPEYRRRGVASALYRAFEAECARAGCCRMKAVTTLGNEGSVRFHHENGWKTEQVADYAGVGRTRVVFSKKLKDALPQRKAALPSARTKRAAPRAKTTPAGARSRRTPKR